jgi:hypothetical protein
MGFLDRFRQRRAGAAEPEPPGPDPAELYRLTSADGAPVPTVYGGSGTVRLRRAGRVELPDGAVVACDPFVGPDDPPLARRVAPGTYGVELRVLELDGDERVAAAVLVLADSRPERWEPAGPSGYPVDSATGCFAAPGALAELARALGEDDDPLTAALEATYRHTWSWAELALPGGGVVAFSSGDGDGIYESWWGFADDLPVCLLTDFALVEA